MAGEFLKKHEHVFSLFLASLNSYKPENPHEALRAQYVKPALGNLFANSEGFESTAPISIRRDGENLIALLQLRHRQALCAFIQNYMDFKKNNSDTTVDKFEALIFSGLSSDPDKIPSTFDGMEQVLRLVKAARGEGE